MRAASRRYAAAKSIEPVRAERVWVDDDEDLQAETKTADRVAPWPFIEEPVHSGKLAREQQSPGLIQHYFHQTKAPRRLTAGDELYTWVWLDPENPPQTVMLQFHDSGNWEHRAYWGADKIVHGGIGNDTPAHKRLGDLPPLGEWFRLTVPIDVVGLEPQTDIAGIAFTQFGGRAIWDDVGIISPEEIESLRPILEVAADDREAPQAALVRDYYRRNHSPEHRTLLLELEAAERELTQLRASIPTTLVASELPEPRPAHILNRGEYDQPGEKVERDTPSFLPPFPEGAPRNRLGLAEWLLDAKNPLTARVTVNRLWQQLFGTGLVRTSEDFGSQGEWPSHPQLLDWLAVEFRESGWDLRALVKALVTSETYRQSSHLSAGALEIDPENRLLARAPRLRLEAEVIRDQALFLSGLLVERRGGPPVKPYQPPGVWEAVGYTDSNTARFTRDMGEALYRRSLYTFWKRTAPPPSMAIFDAPNRETCTVRRERTNTPLAALVLMNDVQFVEAARHFGVRMVKNAENDDARLTFGFRSVTARPPTAEELTELTGALTEFRSAYEADPEAAATLLTFGESPADPSSRTTSMMSSCVMIPWNRCWSSTTGIASKS